LTGVNPRTFSTTGIQRKEESPDSPNSHK
jgi:hypothetical protein